MRVGVWAGTFLAAVLGFRAVAQDAPYTQDDDTMLLLHLDGDGRDAGGNDIHGKAKGPVAWEPGRFGKALSLDGKGALLIPSRGPLHVGESSWTVECWIKPGRQTARHAPIVSSGWGNERHYWLRISYGTHIAVMFSGGTGGVASTKDIGKTLMDGGWHHLAAVLDRERGGEIRLYVDGERVETKKPVFSPPITFEKEGMAAAVGTFAPWTTGKVGYVGLVDEVRLSNTVRAEYASKEPLSPEARARLAPPPRFEFDAAESEQPMTLDPQTTIIATPARYLSGGHVRAAQTLREWLRKIYGVEQGFKIVGERQVRDIKGKSLIALGRSRWADPEETEGLWRDGFVIKRKANVIVIASPKSSGAYYGAVHFLDKFCGVRFYMPTDLFTSLPKSRTITLGDISIRSEPFTRSAYQSGVRRVPGDKGWLQRNASFRRVGGTHQHNMFQVFSPSRYAKKYTEIYPILKGKRYIPEDPRDQRWHPCFSEPSLLDAAMETAREHFKQRPGDAYLAYSVQDSHTVCHCPRCEAVYEKYRGKGEKAMVVTDRGASELYWKFISRLGERFEKELPGRFIATIMYGPVRFPPNYKLPGNIIIFTNFHIAELDADKILAPNEEGVSKLDHVLGIASYYGNHDWFHGRGFLIPRLYTGYWSRFMRELAKKAEGAFMHSEAYPNWGLDGPKYYVLARLWWDPFLDVNGLWTQFCSDMFGPATDPMFDYFMTLERLWVTLDNVKGPERKLFLWQRQFLADAGDRKQLRQCRVLLDRAASLAETGEQKHRVDLFSRTFRVSEYLYELAAAKTASRSKIEEINDYVEHQITPDPMTLYDSKTVAQAIKTLTRRKKTVP